MERIDGENKVEGEQLYHLIRVMLTCRRLEAMRRRTSVAFGDALHDAYLHVCGQLRHYDPSRGKFAAWLFYRVKEGVEKGLRNGSNPGPFGTRRRFGGGLAPVPSYAGGAALGVVEDRAVARSHDEVAAVDAADAAGHVLRRCDARTRDVLTRIGEGQSYAEAGAAHGVCRNRVYQIVGEVRRRLAA
jgi:DNA-directed RNA polymerase specialized sigma24 family protein